MQRNITLAGSIAATAVMLLVAPNAAFGQEPGATGDPALAEPAQEVAVEEGSSTEAPPVVEAPEVPAPPEEAVADPPEQTESAATAEPVETGEPAAATTDAAEAGPSGDDSGTASASRAQAKSTSGGGCFAGREVVGGSNPDVHDALEEQCDAVETDINGNAQDVEVGGITFDFSLEDTPDGQVVNFTTDGPFTGTILVKGGPLHFACHFEDVIEGTCHAPVNPNTDRFYGVSHVDVCVSEEEPDLPPPPPPDDEGPNGPPDREVEVEIGEDRPVGPSTTAAAAAAELPFTGLDAGWLLLVSSALLASGVMLRFRANR